LIMKIEYYKFVIYNNVLTVQVPMQLLRLIGW